MHKEIKFKNKKSLIISLNKSNQPGWFILILGYYDSLNIPTRHFGGINKGFAFVFEFWIPIAFKLFGKDIEAVKQATDLESDILKQTQELENQLKQQENRRKILISKRKK